MFEVDKAKASRSTSLQIKENVVIEAFEEDQKHLKMLTFVSNITLIRLILPYLEKISEIFCSDVLPLSPNTPKHLLFGGGLLPLN